MKNFNWAAMFAFFALVLSAGAYIALIVFSCTWFGSMVPIYICFGILIIGGGILLGMRCRDV